MLELYLGQELAEVPCDEPRFLVDDHVRAFVLGRFHGSLNHRAPGRGLAYATMAPTSQDSGQELLGILPLW